MRAVLAVAVAGTITLGAGPAHAYGPGATAPEAVVYAATAVFGEGNFLALLLAGLWVGIVAAADRRAEARALRLALLGAAIGIVAGFAFGAPPVLDLAIAVSALAIAALIALRVRLPGSFAGLPPALVIGLFAVGLGTTLRIDQAPLAYVTAYFVTFIGVAGIIVAAGAILARPVVRRGGPRVVRGLGIWGVAIMLPVIVLNLVPEGSAFGASGDLTVRSTELADGDIPPLVKGLLERVYLAFEKDDEEEIYDSLAAVAEGDVLVDLYLQKRAALEMEDAGGARSELLSLDIERASGEPDPSGTGYRVHGVWRVVGTVGHWGHRHNRVNRYEADLAIAPVDGVWKIAGFDLLDVVRTDPVPL